MIAALLAASLLAPQPAPLFAVRPLPEAALAVASVPLAALPANAAFAVAAPALLELQTAPDGTQPSPSLDFDLLGNEGKVAVDPHAAEVQAQMQRRRTLLTLHQTVGFVLAAAMIGTMVTGQLNYADKFGGPNTGRYEAVHEGFVISTETLFFGAGALAIFAPVPVAEVKGGGVTRADVHRFAMLGATAGMLTEAGLGIWTASREGYADQSRLAAAHLAVGYVTLALMTVAVSAIVF